MIELCLENIEDVYLADKNRDIVKRIELNSALSVGGLTPNLEILKKAKKITDIPIICMIRLRAGNFIYSKEEMDIMVKDANRYIKYCDGLAFGALDNEFNVDLKNTLKILNICKKNNKEFVFHRAIDITNNYFDNIKLLDGINVNRILTSGNYKNCDLGYSNLKKLNTKCSIIVGGGINLENIHKFKNFEIHGSFSEIYSNILGNHLILSEKKLNKLREILGKIKGE